MRGITSYSYEDEIICTLKKGKDTWLSLADVCKILKVDRGAALKHAKGEVRSMKLGVEKEEVISDIGLFGLAFKLNTPEAKRLMLWEINRVFPNECEEENRAGFIRGESSCKKCARMRRCRELEHENALLSVKNRIMQPKADYFDELVDKSTLTTFRQTADELNMGQRELISFLLDNRFIYRDKCGRLSPYKNKNRGLFEVKECFNEKTGWSGVQTLVTPKGRETFRLLISG